MEIVHDIVPQVHFFKRSEPYYEGGMKHSIYQDRKTLAIFQVWYIQSYEIKLAPLTN